MASVLKHWREASTLIVVTSRRSGLNVKPVFVSSSISSTNAKAVKGVDFQVLLLKRSANSKFMPNLYVFPGGVASDVDFSSDWISVFDFLGEERRRYVFDFVQRGGPGAPMFSRHREPKFTQIPSEIAFRICAIRETFEESGILLAHRVDQSNSSWPNPFKSPSCAAFCHEKSVIDYWRQRVNEDPTEFIRMCRELQMVPDVCSLYEWSNWLTPHSTSRRFDTAFYICCVDDKPHVAEDEGETVHSQWASPAEVLTLHQASKVNIAPPQLYEMSRLVRFQNTSDLIHFSWHRSQHRVKRWLPVKIACADAIFSVLPGDSLYPTNVNPEELQEDYTRKETLAELAVSHPKMHRTVFIPAKPAVQKMSSIHLLCNIHLPGDHVAPVTSIDVQQSLRDGLLPKL